MPTMAADIGPYVEKGTVEVLGANLEGAKYTLALPQKAYDAGVRSFAALEAHRDQFGGRIHGIEPGNDGKRVIQKMDAEVAFALDERALDESTRHGIPPTLEGVPPSGKRDADT